MERVPGTKGSEREAVFLMGLQSSLLKLMPACCREGKKCSPQWRNLCWTAAKGGHIGALEEPTVWISDGVQAVCNFQTLKDLTCHLWLAPLVTGAFPSSSFRLISGEGSGGN